MAITCCWPELFDSIGLLAVMQLLKYTAAAFICYHTWASYIECLFLTLKVSLVTIDCSLVLIVDLVSGICTAEQRTILNSTF